MAEVKHSKNLFPAAGLAAAFAELCVGPSAAGKVVGDRLETLTNIDKIPGRYRSGPDGKLSKEGSQFVRAAARFAHWAVQKRYELPDIGEIGRGGFVELMHKELERIYKQESLSKQDRSFIQNVDTLLSCSNTANAYAVRLLIGVKELITDGTSYLPNYSLDNLLRKGEIELDPNTLNFVRTYQPGFDIKDSRSNRPRHDGLVDDVLEVINRMIKHPIDDMSNGDKFKIYEGLESKYKQVLLQDKVLSGVKDPSWDDFLRRTDPALFLKSALVSPLLPVGAKHRYPTGSMSSYDGNGDHLGSSDVFAELPLHPAGAGARVG